MRDDFHSIWIYYSNLSKFIYFYTVWLIDMKVEKLVELKSQYSFEAPIVPASILKTCRTAKNGINRTTIDLNKHLAPNPDNTFLVKVSGESMIDENIYDGDILIVTKADSAQDGQVVIAALNGEMAVKSFRIIDGNAYLFAANKKFLPIHILPFWEFKIQGVVRHVIHCV